MRIHNRLLPQMAIWCDLSRQNSFPPDDLSKFLVNIPKGRGRLIPPHSGKVWRNAWIAHACVANKKRAPIRRSIARAVLKGGPQESAAKGRARECTWRRSFPVPRTRAYVCVCALRRHRNARTSLVLTRDLSHKVTAMYASLSFFFLSSGKTVGIRDMCLPIHTPRSWSTQERIGGKGRILVVFGKRANAGRRRTTGGAKGGKMRQEWEDDRTCAIHGRHKAVNPWEYRACASGPARGLHELYGLSFSLRVPLFYLRLLFARMAFRPAHGDFFFNTWLH